MLVVQNWHQEREMTLKTLPGSGADIRDVQVSIGGIIFYCVGFFTVLKFRGDIFYEETLEMTINAWYYCPHAHGRMKNIFLLLFLRFWS
mgnify:CR=1 FL=1